MDQSEVMLGSSNVGIQRGLSSYEIEAKKRVAAITVNRLNIVRSALELVDTITVGTLSHDEDEAWGKIRATILERYAHGLAE